MERASFLPVSRADMDERGWEVCDFIVVSGDAYVDHPSFGVPLLGRLLEANGYRVGIVAQPRWVTPEDLAPLFFTDPEPSSITWARLFFLIARYTGLRKGEVQALRMGSFFERQDRGGRAFALVRVSGSWDRIVFKSPKNGRERIAIIPPTPWPEVRAYLEGLGKPDPAALVFEGEAPGRPVSHGPIDYRLGLALDAIGLGLEARRARHLSAHSFRYQVNSELVNAGVASIRTQALLGHVSGDAMTANYYQAGDDFSDVIDALEK